MATVYDDAVPCPSGTDTPQEPPLFSLRVGFVRNPLRFLAAVLWVLAWFWIPAFGVATVLWRRDMCLAAAWLLFALQILAWLSLWRVFGVDRGTLTFYRDAVDVAWRSQVGGSMEEWFPLTSVSHVGLLSPVQLQLRFGDEGVQAPRDVTAAVRGVDGEDLFDHIVEHLQTCAPGHLFSILEGGEVRYSRPWSFEDVDPDAPRVRAASLEVRPGGVPDEVTVGPLELELEKPAWPRRVLRRRGSHALVLVVHGDQVLDPRGCVLATVCRVRDVVTIRAGSGPEVLWNGAAPTELLGADGVRVGRIARDATRAELTFLVPTHALWAAIQLVVLARWSGRPHRVDRPPRHLTGYWERSPGR